MKQIDGGRSAFDAGRYQDDPQVTIAQAAAVAKLVASMPQGYAKQRAKRMLENEDYAAARELAAKPD